MFLQTNVKYRNFYFRARVDALNLLLMFTVLFLGGCVVSGGNALKTHQGNIKDVFKEDYVVLKKPVDQHYIGSAWSKQFGPMNDPNADDIRVRKERSLDNIQQDFAYNVGLQAGGLKVGKEMIGVGIQKGKAKDSQMEGVEIIKPYSLADIPFKPKVPYVTEALRLANFKLQDRNTGSLKAGLVPSAFDGAAGMSGTGGGSTEGTGLVVAYKLHKIDMRKYSRVDTGSQLLELGKTRDLSEAGLFARAKLRIIDPGAGRSLPRNLLWACPRAEAISRDVVAAWVVDIKPKVPGKKSLTIGFPAYPSVEDCSSYSGVISSGFDAATDQIERQIANIVIMEAEVDDSLQPRSWDASISVIDEKFNVKPVKASEVGVD